MANSFGVKNIITIRVRLLFNGVSPYIAESAKKIKLIYIISLTTSPKHVKNLTKNKFLIAKNKNI